MKVAIDAVLAGPVRRFTEAGDTSAIVKTPVDGSRAVGVAGIEGDAQADLSVHGGPDKAIHHYPRDHYLHWLRTLGDLPALAMAGAFGENISTSGLTESEACIGDRFRLGTALVEIAQGRQPCWKQAHRLGRPGIVAAMVRSGKSGWYYRVIEEGAVAAGDVLELVARPHPEWSVERVTALLIAGLGKRQPHAARDLARLAVLSENWRIRAAKLSG